MTTTPDPLLSAGESYLVLPVEEAASRGVIAQSELIIPDLANDININCLTLSFRVLLPPTEVSQQEPVAVLLPISQLQHKQQEMKAINWTTTLTDDQPLMTVEVASPLGQTSIRGLLDTGADVTIIAVRDWPESWPKEETAVRVSGVGGALSPLRSKYILTFTDADKQGATCKPQILPLPTTWERHTGAVGHKN
ncbi:hypothetical protein WISP_102312 [Willisornis vidua]|uniref:Peptidase A2 domain-containing protein n=1 Tax=Willisornis vidua TaxID=1566151 RepID=A0ABQ9CZ70_9PASS|nr:hypothetical protein WISP_102312 [Willisornis vidua]